MTTTTAAAGVAPPHSIEAEQSVLGGILLSDRAMYGLVIEEGLKAEHFFRDRHRAIFEAMLALYGREVSIDVLTVSVELEQAGRLEMIGGKAAIDELTGGVPGLGGVRRYAQIVIEHALVRGLLGATYEIQASIVNHSAPPRELVEHAEHAIRDVAATVLPVGVTDGYLGPDALAGHMLRWLQEEPDEGLALPAQLPVVARKVRLRVGHMTVLAAWPSGGKTATALQLAAAAGTAGGRVVIWSNEDTAEELVAKHVMSATGVPSSVISDRRLSDARLPDVVAALGQLPFEVQPCHDWSAAQIATHIRQVRPTLAIVDHFHNLAQIGKVAEIDEAIRVLAAAAGQSPCHLILCAQLNRARMSGVCKPPPVAADLRGSGMFLAAAHTMLLVHRDEEEIEDAQGHKTGKALQLDTGSIDVAKNKVTGRTGVVRVVFDATRLRFVEPERESRAEPDAWLA